MRKSATNQTAPTMADVITNVGEDDQLHQTRKRDLISAVNRTCELLGRDPALVPASIGDLKAGFATVHPAQHGIAPKTFQNLKANVRAAVKHVCGDRPAASKRRPLALTWAALSAKLPDTRYQGALSRLIRYCSDQAISPECVSDAVVDAFMDHVRTETFAAKPNDILRRATRVWNEAVEKIPGWPQIRLAVPDFRKPRESTPLEAYPPDFQNDVEAHSNWLSGHDLFADNPPPKVCRPRTIKQRRLFIVLAASALLRQGWTIDRFTSLQDLVSVDAVKAVLTDYVKKSNQGPTTFMRSLATALIHIARHYVRVDADHVDALKDLRRRLGPQREGMTEKNKATLRQFDDESNLLRLLNLPGNLIAEVERGKLPDHRAAVKVQIALAIGILLCAPLRMHNLVGLRLDSHVIRPGGKQGPVHLVVPEDEAKGGQTIEYPLPDWLKDLLDLYLARYRIIICSDACPWLFAVPGGKQKSQQTLSQQLRETVSKYTGLTITPHQFRHLAAKIMLDQNPGQYETVRQFLAHKSTKSTMTFYADLQTPNAARHYDQILSAKHEALSQQYDHKGRPR